MAGKVLATYELLEAILHALPTKDLLLSQRVCRTWRGIITRSEKLQRALFLLPVKGGALVNQWKEASCDVWSYPQGITAMKVFVNPLLYPLHRAMRVRTGNELEQRLDQSWRRPEASWRRMLLSQPATIVEVYDDGKGLKARHEEHLTRAGDMPESVGRGYKESDAFRWPNRVDGDYLWSRLEDNMQLEMLPAEQSEDDEIGGDIDDCLPGWL